VAVTIETATTIEPYLAATIKIWPAKYETLTTGWNRNQLQNSNLLCRN